MRQTVLPHEGQAARIGSKGRKQIKDKENVTKIIAVV